ncbi:MAG TPA: hypothetical protein VFO78_10900 [Candidatus Limnocylindrales bacterium]|nr:hypothetical protein [Candidatus Limnocylindrales bacterium]
MTQTRFGRPPTAEELDARLDDQRGIGWPESRTWVARRPAGD